MQDWIDQAGQMCSIYQHSSVTIAVHSAENSLAGFLWRRQVPNSLEISPRSTNPKFMLEIPQLSEEAIYRRLGSSQITPRAWITQELCLSQVVLHFVEDRAIWECYHEDCATTHPFEDYMEIFQKRSAHPSQDWLPFVANYSTCSMTKESDKLAAIAGVAQAWPRDSNYFQHGGYYCGIFDDDVHSSLLWYRTDSRLIRRTHRAPSWSWASVDGEISFICEEISFRHLPPLMEITSLNCTCGRNLKDHFLCTCCHIQVKAVVQDDIEVSFGERSKRFYSTPANGPRYVTTLGYFDKRAVGWAIFDCGIQDEDYSIFRYVPVVAKVVNDTTRGFFVIIVKPSSGGIRNYLRVGMGYVFDTDPLKTFSQEEFVLV